MLKPPYSIRHEHFSSVIWDTFHLNFLSNLDSRQLETSLMTSYGHFCNMSVVGDSEAIQVIIQNWVPSEIFFFSMKE